MKKILEFLKKFFKKNPSQGIEDEISLKTGETPSYKVDQNSFPQE